MDQPTSHHEFGHSRFGRSKFGRGKFDCSKRCASSGIPLLMRAAFTVNRGGSFLLNIKGSADRPHFEA